MIENFVLNVKLLLISQSFGFILFVFILSALSLNSCKVDEPELILASRGIDLVDGLYLSKDGTDPALSSVLLPERVEADSFKTQVRSGFLAGYLWMEAGNYQAVQITDSLVTATIGGFVTTVDMGANSDCGHTEIKVIETMLNGPAFAIAETGLYKVTHDIRLNEMVLYNIKEASVIETTIVSSSDTPLQGVLSDTLGLWQADAVSLGNGFLKVRLNCNWIINRRINTDASLSQLENGYQLFTHFGGIVTDTTDTVIELVSGGAGFDLENSIYDLSLSWRPLKGFNLEID